MGWNWCVVKIRTRYACGSLPVLARARYHAHMKSFSSPPPAQVAYIGSAPAEPPYLPLPLMLTRVAAGFPSPADDYVEQMLDRSQRVLRAQRAGDLLFAGRT